MIRIDADEADFFVGIRTSLFHPCCYHVTGTLSFQPHKYRQA